MLCGASLSSTAGAAGTLISVTAASALSSSCFGDVIGSDGVAGGVCFLASLSLASRFFSSVRRKTLIVVRRDLFGLQSAAETGLCSQTGHEDGSVEWPLIMHISMRAFDMQSELILTCFANRLVATWQTVRIHSQPAADCATQLRWNVFLGERAAWILA